MTYAEFEAAWSKGFNQPEKGMRFEQPIAYQKAAAASAVRAEFERRVIALGRAGKLSGTADMPERECPVCGDTMNRCSFWQCGAA